MPSRKRPNRPRAPNVVVGVVTAGVDLIRAVADDIRSVDIRPAIAQLFTIVLVILILIFIPSAILGSLV